MKSEKPIKSKKTAATAPDEDLPVNADDDQGTDEDFERGGTVRRPSRFLPADPTQPAVEFRKAVEAIHIRVTNGKLTLMGRKLWNVLLYNAQEQGIDRPKYEIQLSTIIKDHEFDKDHLAYLKEQLKKLNITQVEWDVFSAEGEQKVWAVATLITGAKIENGKLSYSFDPEVRLHLLAPTRWQRMDLRTINQFRKGPALALYENTVRFIGNTAGNENGVALTSRAHWEKWADLLADEKTNKPRDFKYWKRDVLTVAIEEINQVSDIEIEPLFFKNGRFISDIQFRVTRRKQNTLDFGEEMSVNAELIKRMIKLGVSDKDAHDSLARYGESAVEATLQEVELRLKNTKQKKIDVPQAYFLKCLRTRGAAIKQAAVPAKEKPAAKKSSVAQKRNKLEEQFHIYRAQQEKIRFATLSPAEKAAVVKDFEEFIRNNETLNSSYRKYGFSAKTVETALYNWMESRLPFSDSDLMQYVFDAGMLPLK